MISNLRFDLSCHCLRFPMTKNLENYNFNKDKLGNLKYLKLFQSFHNDINRYLNHEKRVFYVGDFHLKNEHSDSEILLKYFGNEFI